MSLHSSLSTAGVAMLLVSAPAFAEAPEKGDWFVKLAATRLTLADGITLRAGGALVPNAGIETKPHWTPTFQVGGFFTKNFAVSFTGGVPPHISIQGEKTLKPFGKLAETTYGPATLTVQYYPLRDKTFQPYVGFGTAYMHVFSSKDAAFQNVKIDDDLGTALEAGTNIMVNKNYGFFLEAKKAFLRTTANGTFGGAPVQGRVKLDPWALSAGVMFRF